MRGRIDFDAAPPVPVSGYRAMQAKAPGGDALYASMTAIFEASLAEHSHILIVGAGGGAEIEALGASAWEFDLTGVDPSASMIGIAQPYADGIQPAGRARLINGMVDDLPASDRFQAATSIMVMHFLPDDGAKAAYLAAIRSRLVSGAPYIHADVSVDVAGGAELLVPVIRRYTERAGLPDFGSQFADSGSGVYPLVEARQLALFKASGFRLIAPVFRGLWYAGWWMEAA